MNCRTFLSPFYRCARPAVTVSKATQDCCPVFISRLDSMTVSAEIGQASPFFKRSAQLCRLRLSSQRAICLSLMLICYDAGTVKDPEWKLISRFLGVVSRSHSIRIRATQNIPHDTLVEARQKTLCLKQGAGPDLHLLYLYPKERAGQSEFPHAKENDERPVIVNDDPNIWSFTRVPYLFWVRKTRASALAKDSNKNVTARNAVCQSLSLVLQSSSIYLFDYAFSMLNSFVALNKASIFPIWFLYDQLYARRVIFTIWLASFVNRCKETVIDAPFIRPTFNERSEMRLLYPDIYFFATLGTHSNTSKLYEKQSFISKVYIFSVEWSSHFDWYLALPSNTCHQRNLTQYHPKYAIDLISPAVSKTVLNMRQTYIGRNLTPEDAGSVRAAISGEKSVKYIEK